MRHLMSPFLRTAAVAIALSPLAAGAHAAAAQPQKVSLQPNFTPEYQARLIMETTRTSTRMLQLGPADAKPQENATSGQQTIEFLMRITRSDDAGSVVTLRVERIEMSAKTTRGEFEWKSTDPRTPGDNANLALTTMRPSLGAVLTFEFDPKGNVVKADNGGVQMPTGEIVDFIRLAVGTQEARARWSPLLAPKKDDFNAEIGQKWSHEEKLNNPPLGQFTATTEYTLKSADDSQAIIDLTGEYELGPGPDGQAPMFKIKDSSVTGSIVWDRTLGFFKSMELDQRIELEGNAQGIPLGFRTETNVKIRREEATPAKAP